MKVSDNRMKKDIAMANGTYYSWQQRKAVRIAEIDRLIEKIKRHHSITMFMLNIAILFMLVFNAFAVALFLGLLR